MDILHSPKAQQAFDSFVHDFNLTPRQQEQFLIYLSLLLEASKNFNITSILDVENIIDFHFRDSLYVTQHITISSYKGIVDVGTGGGLPGIPVKICYPEMPTLLIEVQHKKINYLDNVIEQLKLDAIDIYTLDWRTFLRKTSFDLNLFFSRASLSTTELVRMFKPSCPYNHATLVYWASKHWTPGLHEKPFLRKKIEYKIQNKNRILAFFDHSHTKKSQ